MKSKNVKIPLELVDMIEKRSGGKPPGEVLFEIYKEYELIEGLASSIRANKKNLVKASVYEVLLDRDQKINELQTQIDEVKMMLKGLEIFFTKVKK